MMRPASLFLVVLFCAGTFACGDNGPTAPSATSGFNGQWSGTTSQGRPITFTVSSDHVTAVTIGYNFGGCSGSRTFSNLNLDIAQPPGAPTTPPTPPFFQFASPASDGLTMISGFFRTNTSADGIVAFDEYPGCGGGGGVWVANKR